MIHTGKTNLCLELINAPLSLDWVCLVSCPGISAIAQFSMDCNCWNSKWHCAYLCIRWSRVFIFISCYFYLIDFIYFIFAFLKESNVLVRIGSTGADQICSLALHTSPAVSGSQWIQHTTMPQPTAATEIGQLLKTMLGHSTNAELFLNRAWESVV